VNARIALSVGSIALIWGTSFLFIRIAIEEVSPLEGIRARMVPDV